MHYLLDTNICIYLMNTYHPKIELRMAQCGQEDVVLSSIVVSELMFGLENSQQYEENKAELQKFLDGFTMLEYGMNEATVYGSVRAELKRTGQKIGAVDTFIAAHALANELVLVTNNTREFLRVPNLQLEDWTQ